MSFAVGDRVMVTEWGVDPTVGELTGYFGHVTHVSNLSGARFWVKVEGRVGGPVHPQIAGWAWPFQAQELEHAD